MALTDDEDYLQLIKIVAANTHHRRHLRKKSRRNYRKRINCFNYFNDQEFLCRYRLPKDTVKALAVEISDEVQSATNWNHALTPDQMLLVTLRFFATGSFLEAVGDLHGIHKSTTSRVILKVSRALARLHGKHIKMPESQEEKDVVMTEFYNISSFPRCIGALDCTHIRIQNPGGLQAETFRNRKDFSSFNVQVICDAKLLIRNIVCRWPGSCHDSTIFNNSNIRARFEFGEFGDSIILGDSGYGIKRYLLTPLTNPRTRAELLYNESQIRARNPVERCFGVWKRRFPVLALGIRLKLQTVQTVVVACAVLHNIARQFNLPDPPVNRRILQAIRRTRIAALPIGNMRRSVNNEARQVLIDQYFGNM